MLINIVDVGAPNTHAAKNGRSYQSIEVMYKNDSGQAASKKLVSFRNPSVFNHIKNLAKGDSVNVTTVKNNEGYWDWTGIEGEGEATVTTATTTNKTTPTRVTGSNYETKEERAQRQVYIIRQSSLSNAIALLGSDHSVSDVLNVAKQFEEYVFAKDSGIDAINSLEDDVPA